MTDEKVRLNDLTERARATAISNAGPELSALLLELAAALDGVRSQEEVVRREAFREGIRGAAKVIRNRQASPGSPLGDLLSSANSDPEAFAAEVTKAAGGEPVTISDLRRLRNKVANAAEGSEEMDADLRRIYYSIVNERNPTSADILPPGSPSRSLDVATFIVERILKDGWWALSNGGVNAAEKPIGKVGLTTDHDIKPQTAATTPLTLIAALVMLLIENAKAG